MHVCCYLRYEAFTRGATFGTPYIQVYTIHCWTLAPARLPMAGHFPGGQVKYRLISTSPAGTFSKVKQITVMGRLKTILG